MENRKSMLVIDDDENFASGLAAHARYCENFIDAAYALDGDEGFKMLQILNPDIVVLDAVMPKLDGLGFLRKLKNCGCAKKPVIIMNSHSQLISLINAAAEYGIDYFMVKPQSYQGICATAYDIACRTTTSPASAETSESPDTLEKSVTLFLRNLGVPAHLDGYRYMRSAILMTIEDTSLLSPITKKLYPRIADTYNTNKCCVERAMRHAIGVSWQRGNKKLLSDIFGYCPDNSALHRPTNSEYIAMAVDDFKLKLKYDALRV